MPYIAKALRENIDKKLDELFELCYTPTLSFSAGELNYVITRLLHLHLLQKEFNYTTLNETIGVLECAKQELYRMVITKYEDKKRLENGAVSELDAIGLNEVR